ncbi:folate-binding protein YgfZ [Tersicoccus sp. Bi-70]|uniref:CAF17-like 4Fe-4S cluster assembly/insertion protein YgfZ n=1 Tax=Tersicoccus sp. Bi-70 TaxID=1897634 RepID=UPI0009755089|nr:folate-binding protein YgfZ [Tersicoccus sp. Bi-70]OMH34912.1 aminomethyltransferase [Tersicoccus sp. Bi-70]
MSPTSPLLSRHGAVPDEGADAGIAAHYGDPAQEQRALTRGRAVVDLSNRGVVTVTGPDRLSWLHTLSSQQLTGLPAGVTTETLLLSVQGRIEFDLLVTDDGERTWLLTDVGQHEDLARWLDSMRFMLRVEVADVTDAWAAVGAALDVEDTPAPLRDALTHFADPWPRLGPGGFAYTVGEDHPAATWHWSVFLVPREDLERTVDALAETGVGLAGHSAAEALRVAAWRPRYARDVDEKTIPHELDLIRTGVHLAKGCYKGQETVARVHNLGHPPRRLVFLHLDGSEHTLPAAGSEVRSGERAVGRVTSVAQHGEMGPIALAVIKRSVDPEATLVVVDGDSRYAAAQEIIVAPDAGQVVGRPAGLLNTRRG